MGVYSSYVHKQTVQQEEAVGIEFNAPDRTFKGIMNTVCEIHEMDQKVFESLLELDFASVLLKEDGEEKEAKESKIKNILAAIKKVIDKAVNAIKTAISNFIERIQKSGADKVKEYADFVEKSDKLKDFKATSSLLKSGAESILFAKKNDIINTNKESYKKIETASNASEVNDAKTTNFETIKGILELKVDDLFETVKDKSFSAQDIKKLAEKFDSTKHTIKNKIKVLGNDMIAQITKQGENAKAAINSSNSDIKEIAAEGAYSIASNSTKGFLKLQSAIIDVIVKDYKNSRSIIIAAYSFCKKGSKAAAEDNKAEEKKDEVNSESVLIDNICESSDAFIDGLMLV